MARRGESYLARPEGATARVAARLLMTSTLNYV